MFQNHDNTVSISIFTGCDWFVDLYNDLHLHRELTNPHVVAENVIALSDNVVHAFRESQYNVFGLDLLTVWNWSENISFGIYGTHDAETEHRLTNSIVLFYWLLAEYVQHNDTIVAMAIELPDILHVTFQKH